MSSYCEVCRGLFDIPHYHGDGDTPVRVPGALSPLRAAAASSTAAPVCARSSSSYRSSPAFAVRSRGSSSQQRRQGSLSRRRRPSTLSSRVSPAAGGERGGSRRGSPPTPSAVGVERETVSTLLRMSSPVRASALVRTPSPGLFLRNCSGRTSTTRLHARSRRGILTPQSKEKVRSLSAGHVAKEHMTQRLDHLHETLERIREAVRRDNAAVGTRGPSSTPHSAAAVFASGGVGGGASAESWHLDSNNNKNSSSSTSSSGIGRSNSDGVGVGVASSQPALCGSLGGTNDGLPNLYPCRSSSCSRGLSFATSRGSLSEAIFPREVTETHTYDGQDAAELEPFSSSCEKSSTLREGLKPFVAASSSFSPPGTTSAAAAPTTGPQLHLSTGVAAISAGTQTPELPAATLPRGELPTSSSSASRGTGANSNATFTHLEALREGFVELCSAVREDLQALHIRVNALQRPQAQQQQKEPSTSESVPYRHVEGRDYENADAGLLQSSTSYEKLLAELQQYTVLTVHKALQQQQQQQQESKERYGGNYGFAPTLSEAMPFSSLHLQPTKPSLPQWNSLAMDDMYAWSPETFDAHVRSAVRAILHEDSFRHDARELLAEQQAQRGAMKALRNEWKRRCTELEEQLNALTDATESMRLDVEELRLQAVGPPSPPPPPAKISSVAPTSTLLPQPPLMPSSGGVDPPLPARAATLAGAAPEVWEDRLVKRVQKLIADSEERWLQRVQGEIVQPVLEHVRRLMSAHQSMIETVVESRCAQFETYVDRGRHGWEVQVAELRSRVSSLRGDMHRALKDLCQNLNMACPGL
ncbi:hypothetical protein MOQ_007729 [Trypanosoma cruzi marinkellei]|uniref:Uncharacterized protein n=1 Tax=Trypanosoma cruzi marinkellei TaxID=85056 RepID=K2N1W7_TRYCR|nr:hypothetical protein MOQ_007729 [Trypanosoma cruzi marinkellei]